MKDNKFSEWLRELRTEKSLSIQKLSQELDNKISKSSICAWELNQQILNLDAVIILAKYFNVSLDYLVGLSDY